MTRKDYVVIADELNRQYNLDLIGLVNIQGMALALDRTYPDFVYDRFVDHCTRADADG